MPAGIRRSGVHPGQVVSQSRQLTHRDRQPFTLTVTPLGNLETPINLTSMYLDCGRKPEHPEKTHAGTGWIANSTKPQPANGFEPKTFFQAIL